jgi:hypothetical protein
VLITSRRKLTDLTDAYPLSLDVLGRRETERLFIKLVGVQRCADRDAVRRILARVVGYRWRSGLSPGGYATTKVSCSPM